MPRPDSLRLLFSSPVPRREKDRQRNRNDYCYRAICPLHHASPQPNQCVQSLLLLVFVGPTFSRVLENTTSTVIPRSLPAAGMQSDEESAFFSENARTRLLAVLERQPKDFCSELLATRGYYTIRSRSLCAKIAAIYPPGQALSLRPARGPSLIVSTCCEKWSHSFCASSSAQGSQCAIFAQHPPLRITHNILSVQVLQNRRHFVTTCRLRAACFLEPSRAMLQSDYNFSFSLCWMKVQFRCCLSPRCAFRGSVEVYPSSTTKCEWKDFCC